MAGYATKFLYDGTAAMKPVPDARHATPRIIAFPAKDYTQHRRANEAAGIGGLRERLFAWTRNCLLASEMFCSLAHEDARGVAYLLFSKANITALVLASFIVAAVSIAYGA